MKKHSRISLCTLATTATILSASAAAQALDVETDTDDLGNLTIDFSDIVGSDRRIPFVFKATATATYVCASESGGLRTLAGRDVKVIKVRRGFPFASNPKGFVTGRVTLDLHPPYMKRGCPAGSQAELAEADWNEIEVIRGRGRERLVQTGDAKRYTNPALPGQVFRLATISLKGALNVEVENRAQLPHDVGFKVKAGRSARLVCVDDQGKTHPNPNLQHDVDDVVEQSGQFAAGAASKQTVALPEPTMTLLDCPDGYTPELASVHYKDLALTTDEHANIKVRGEDASQTFIQQE
ncbi:hypothetical protein [Polyangium sp. 15x6]|uniref:hypothetical protein n=1 Tax=Polyangium sp. 15x6 TaxID=3042687 RepID=UPI00249B62F7|nr:hypothetical protein [Polyangium sp. 15x6]MDI3287497.1 hypothetical protein [Polyangium sp. 15x6]